ncbi:MAG: sigma-70 family RNA polymerase sigma factor [Planctomycetaceae bacterium]
MNDDTEQSFRDVRFRELLLAVEQGEPGAAAAIVDEFGPSIMRAVRRRMNRRIRDCFDSEDFAQAVWASFFGHLSVVQRISSASDLAGFLGRMASNKVIDAGRRSHVRSEQNSSEGEISSAATDNRRQLSQPTPSQFAMANEQWDRLAGSDESRHTQLLKLRRSGATHAEIAQAMGVSERHVRRILSRLSRQHLSDTDSTA